MGKKIYKGIYKGLDIFDSFTSVIFVGLMVVCIFLQILFRYVFKNALVWSEELSRYAMIYIVFLGVGVGTKYESHMGVDFFVNMLPEKIKNVVGVLAKLVTLAIYITCAVLGWQLTQTAMEHSQLSPAMRIPMYLVYLALPIGFIAGSLRVTQKLLDPIVLKEDKREIVKEDAK